MSGPTAGADAQAEIERLRDRLRDRRRLMAALGALVVVGLVLALTASQYALALAGLAVIALVLVGGRQSVDSARLDVATDDALLAGGPAAATPEAVARAAQVSSPRHRAMLAVAIDDLVRIADDHLERAAQPLQLESARESRRLLVEMGELVRSPEPLDPVALVRAERLVRSPDSPLRRSGGADQFRAQAEEALRALREQAPPQ